MTCMSNRFCVFLATNIVRVGHLRYHKYITIRAVSSPLRTGDEGGSARAPTRVGTLTGTVEFGTEVARGYELSLLVSLSGNKLGSN